MGATLARLAVFVANIDQKEKFAYGSSCDMAGNIRDTVIEKYGPEEIYKTVPSWKPTDRIAIIAITNLTSEPVCTYILGDPQNQKYHIKGGAMRSDSASIYPFTVEDLTTGTSETYDPSTFATAPGIGNSSD